MTLSVGVPACLFDGVLPPAADMIQWYLVVKIQLGQHTAARHGFAGKEQTEQSLLKEHLHYHRGQLQGGRHAAELERAAAKLRHPQPFPSRAHQVTQFLAHAAQVLRACAGSTPSHASSFERLNKSHDCCTYEDAHFSTSPKYQMHHSTYMRTDCTLLQWKRCTTLPI